MSTDSDSIIKLKDTKIAEQKREIRDLKEEIHAKDVHINNLEALVQSLRIKNRIKRRIQSFVKLFLILKRAITKPSLIIKFLIATKRMGLKNSLRKTIDTTVVHYATTKKIDIGSLQDQPLISIIMPVYNVDPKWLDLAIKSIERQYYKNWELCIVDDASTNEELKQYLQSLSHSQIKIKFLDTNLNISGASNVALQMASGEYIALMDNDDELTEDALYHVVKWINLTKADLIYSDEDKMDLNDNYSSPHFKPEFAPDHLFSQNYISHLSVYRKSIVNQLGGFRIGYEGSQDYDLLLRFIDVSRAIAHIPEILYHWRMVPGSTAARFDSKSYAQEAGKRALEDSLKRRGIKGEVLNGELAGTYRVKYAIQDSPLVSIVIPFKDKPELLKMCIESILKKSTYSNFEIIGISNNSEDEATFNEMERLESLDKRIHFYEYNIPFNYSKINNHAVDEYTQGEHIILLNNDIEIITPEWIENMLEHSQREEIGCVGAKLYYPNDTIQHAGVIMGLGGVAGHSHKYFPRDAQGYFGRLNIIQNYSAVTAACLMVKKSIYLEVDGLNEKDLKIAFNDVDFCLRIRELGYYNLFTPYCEAYHHESISRGHENTPEKEKRFQKEVLFMQSRHHAILRNGDPFYNLNLTTLREDFSLK